MSNSKRQSRRTFVVVTGAALAYSALPQRAAAGTKTAPAGPQPFAIPDYNNNPFLRPIGTPHTPADPPRPTAAAVSGDGVGA